MADYSELLDRAVKALPENSGAARQAVYQKARSALVSQLRGITPPLPQRDITQHRLQLEDCVRTIEDKYTAASEFLDLRSSKTRTKQLERFAANANSQSDHELYTQRAASYNFEERGGKLFGVASGQERSDAFTNDLLEIARAKCSVASTKLGQSPEHVRRSVDDLQIFLAQDLRLIRPGVLLGHFRTLEASTSSLNFEEFFSEAIAALLDLQASLDDLKSAFPEIASIEAARLALQATSGDLEGAYKQSIDMVTIAQRSPVVDTSVIVALLEVPKHTSKLEFIIGSSRDDLELAKSTEARAKLIAQHLLSARNFVSAVTQITQREILNYAREAIPRVRKGTLEGIEEGAKGVTKAAFVTLAFQLGGIVAAMAVAMTSFEPLARKNAEIRDLAEPQDNPNTEMEAE